MKQISQFLSMLLLGVVAFCFYFVDIRQNLTNIHSIIPISEKIFTSEKKATSFRCKVVGISDGDTLTCLQNKRQYKVRLLFIDTPESGQAYGKQAKKALSNLVYQKEVVLEISGNDRYNRTLAVVKYKGKNVNLSLVEQGFAWAYRPNTRKIYLEAEEKAKKQRKGLWRDKNPINPAEWRKQNKRA